MKTEAVRPKLHLSETAVAVLGLAFFSVGSLMLVEFPDLRARGDWGQIEIAGYGMMSAVFFFCLLIALLGRKFWGAMGWVAAAAIAALAIIINWKLAAIIGAVFGATFWVRSTVIPAIRQDGGPALLR